MRHLFTASAGASPAYLTVSEIFPVEIRAAITIVGGIVGILLGVKAVGRQLEQVARPLSAVAATPGRH